MPKRSSKSTTTSQNALLVEVAWEVCNQVGGIYTVIRSKACRSSDQPGKRNNVENYSSAFDWENLIKHYEEAYRTAL